MLRSLTVLRSFTGISLHLRIQNVLSSVLDLVPCTSYHVSCCLCNGPRNSIFGYFFFLILGTYFCPVFASHDGLQPGHNTFLEPRGFIIPFSFLNFWPALPLTAKTASHVQIFRHSLFRQTRSNFAMTPKKKSLHRLLSLFSFAQLLTCRSSGAFLPFSHFPDFSMTGQLLFSAIQLHKAPQNDQNFEVTMGRACGVGASLRRSSESPAWSRCGPGPQAVDWAMARWRDLGLLGSGGMPVFT